VKDLAEAEWNRRDLYARKLYRTLADTVIYCGPTDGPYFPAEQPGIVERIGERISVRYPWGLHYFAAENLKVVGKAMRAAA